LRNDSGGGGRLRDGHGREAPPLGEQQAGLAVVHFEEVALGFQAVGHGVVPGVAEHARLFRLWHKFRGGQIDRGQLQLRSIPIQKRIFALAERHLDSPHREVRNLATALFDAQ
jgi:hypothetical protein